MENTSLVPLSDAEAEKAKVRPIKLQKWERAPQGDVEMSIRDRMCEFFGSPEIPVELKPFGFLGQEAIVQSARQLENQDYLTALYTRSSFAGKPTIFALQLYPDKMNIVMSPVGDYPNFTLDLTAVQLNVLDKLTGSVAKEIASEIPEISDTLLSSDTDKEAKKQAKVELMRFLAKKHPDEMKGIHEMLMPAVGIAFIPDGENPVVRLSIDEIPETDSVLGETMGFYKAIRVYKDLEVMLSREEAANMTVGKIENFLKHLDPKLQKALMGKYPDPGLKSWRIFELFQKFGYKGNEEQQKWEKSERMSMGLHMFSDKLRIKILSTIIEGKSLAEVSLTKSGIDKLFRDTYIERRGVKKLPESFSITDVVLNKVPLKDIDIK